MSDLPKERLAYQSSPFTKSGVDYFRPFYVTIRRTTEKRWGFFITCLTIRAVHVEIVTSMDTSSCFMGVEWFVSRRGTPAIISSDNGTNFIGAEKEFRESIEKWNVVNIAADFAHKDIKWRFNPPSAQDQGGIWERLVRSFKRVLYTILGTRRLTVEVLHTKWQTSAEQHLKAGDLVWIVEETNPRGYYPTARIVELRYGSDSVRSSAVLRTSTGSLVCPLVKLAPVFPTSSSGPENVT